MSDSTDLNCTCRTDHTIFQNTELDDYDIRDYDMIWAFQCDNCAQKWLRVLFEAPQKQGHWYDAAVPKGFNLDTLKSKEDVEALFLSSSLRFVGGNYFKGKSEPFSGVPKRLV